jgi:hypothetical protein
MDESIPYNFMYFVFFTIFYKLCTKGTANDVEGGGRGKEETKQRLRLVLFFIIITVWNVPNFSCPMHSWGGGSFLCCQP